MSFQESKFQIEENLGLKNLCLALEMGGRSCHGGVRPSAHPRQEKKSQ
jgi:hypothetical protein